MSESPSQVADIASPEGPAPRERYTPARTSVTSTSVGGTAVADMPPPRTAPLPDTAGLSTATVTEADNIAVAPRPKVADSADYHNERRRYLARARRNPGLRQRYLRSLLGYLILRGVWSFGFFPVVLAVWVPLVLAEFNPVVMVQSLLPHLHEFVTSNPQVQARTMTTVVSGWFSVGLFFFLFDVVIHPFRSPFQREADIHMRAWSQSQGLVPPDEM